MKKRAVLLAAWLFSSISILPVRAEGESTPTPSPSSGTDVSETDTAPSLHAPEAVLIDAASGSVLYEIDSSTSRDPASLTKLMGLYLAASQLAEDDTLTLSDTAFNTYDHSSGVLWIQSGETLSVMDCLEASMLVSANDTMAMLAEGVSGGNDAFVQAMNDQAESWNLTATHFDNIFGTYSENNYASAKDLALLTRQALQNPLFKEVFCSTSYTIAPTNLQVQKRSLSTDCALLKDGDQNYAYAVGGKIGYTQEGGYCLSVYAERGDTGVIAVVMGEGSEEFAYEDIRTLCDYGFGHYQTVTITKEEIGTQTVELREYGRHTGDLIFSAASSYSILLSSSVDASALKGELVIDNADAQDPDQITARIVFTLDGNVIGETEAVKEVVTYDLGSLTGLDAMSYFDWGCIALLVLVGAWPLFRKLAEIFRPPESRY